MKEKTVHRWLIRLTWFLVFCMLIGGALVPLKAKADSLITFTLETIECHAEDTWSAAQVPVCSHTALLKLLPTLKACEAQKKSIKAQLRGAVAAALVFTCVPVAK